MTAIVDDRPGPPDMWRVDDAPTPLPAAGQLLVEVVAVSIDHRDWETRHGAPADSRIGGLRRPRRGVRGSDIAGRVETGLDEQCEHWF